MSDDDDPSGEHPTSTNNGVLLLTLPRLSTAFNQAMYILPHATGIIRPESPLSAPSNLILVNAGSNNPDQSSDPSASPHATFVPSGATINGAGHINGGVVNVVRYRVIPEPRISSPS